MTSENYLNAMQTKLAQTPHLLRLGQLFSETILFEVDQEQFYLTFEKGQLIEVTPGPSRKIPWTFAIRTTSDVLREFWQPVPKPGYHDLFGWVKNGWANVEGDILVLVKNLRFIKEFLALPRHEEMVS